MRARIPRMTRRLLTGGLVLLLGVPVVAQEPVDTAMIAKIKAEATERGQVLDTFNQLANVIGPRLTNSPAHKRAVQWTSERLKQWGLSNVHSRAV